MQYSVNRFGLCLAVVCMMSSEMQSQGLPQEDAKSRELRFATDYRQSYRDLADGPYAKRFPGGRGWSLAVYGGSGVSEGAVLRALRWLMMNQEVDGSWLAESGEQNEGRFNIGLAPAMTGLALLALVGHGERPGSQEFGQCVDKAIAWFIDNQDNHGHFRGTDETGYSHAIATYALCESLALIGHPDIRGAATRAIDVIIRGQNPSGGWNYGFRPASRDDTSLMSWCAQALFAAREAGVNAEGLDAAVTRAADAFRRNAGPSGAFGYVGATDVHNELTGAAVFSLLLLDRKAGDQTKKGLAWLSSVSCDWENPWSENPIYHWYYVTQSKFHAGGDAWNAWNKDFVPDLVRNQVVIRDAMPNIVMRNAAPNTERKVDIGYWVSPSDKEHCQSRVYTTALCALMLETYYRYRPCSIW